RTGASRRISPLSQGAIRAAGADGGVEACAPGEKRRSRPISRVLSRAVLPLGAASPLRSSSLPGPDAGHVMRSLFGLAPGGVCRAGLLPGSRCALTTPFHPYHARLATPFGGIFLLHFPSARAAQALPGTVPCGARTFLGILANDATAWPTPPGPILRVRALLRCSKLNTRAQDPGRTLAS